MLPRALSRSILTLRCINATTTSIAARSFSSSDDDLPSRAAPTKPGVQGFAHRLPWKGQPADTKPTKVQMKKGEVYRWCACGWSDRQLQPWCDDVCKRDGYTELSPVVYVAEKDKTVLMCDCKQTENRPFCDGKHKHVTKLMVKQHRLGLDPKVVYYTSPVDTGVAKELGFRAKKNHHYL